MNTIVRTFAAALLAAVAALPLQAHDFVVVKDGQKLFFNVKSKTGHTAEVTFEGSRSQPQPPKVKGTLSIPDKVKYKDEIYSVVAIGDKAFAGAGSLKAVVMPNGIRHIGSFAFEDCTQLESVVFPGNPVTLGQGTFFRCTQIEKVTFGSDWQSVDLAMFRWSTRLASLFIPAKMTAVRHLDMLKALEHCEADANNGNYTTQRGVLYTKGGHQMVKCPRAYKGTLVVADGTETVLKDALAGCTGITTLVLPASLTSLPFFETAHMAQLKAVVMQAEKPIATAYRNGKGMLGLQVARPDVTLVVPDKSRKAYRAALAQEGGEYARFSQSGDIPRTVRAEQWLPAKNIEGAKNFDQYLK